MIVIRRLEPNKVPAEKLAACLKRWSLRCTLGARGKYPAFLGGGWPAHARERAASRKWTTAVLSTPAWTTKSRECPAPGSS